MYVKSIYIFIVKKSKIYIKNNNEHKLNKKFLLPYTKKIYLFINITECGFIIKKQIKKYIIIKKYKFIIYVYTSK